MFHKCTVLTSAHAELPNCPSHKICFILSASNSIITCPLVRSVCCFSQCISYVLLYPLSVNIRKSWKRLLFCIKAHPDGKQVSVELHKLNECASASNRQSALEREHNQF